MSDDLADIYTLLKRSYLRGTGLRLTKEQVHELYERPDRDKRPEQTAEKIVESLFTNGAGQKARRLVLELEDWGGDGGGYSKIGAFDLVYRILKEGVKG